MRRFEGVAVDYLDIPGMIPAEVKVSAEIPRELFLPAPRIGRIVLPEVWAVQLEGVADAEIRLRKLTTPETRPGLIEEMIALLCLEDIPTPLFALGTQWPEGDNLYVAEYCEVEGERRLTSFWIDGPEEMSALGPGCWFVAVPVTAPVKV